MGRRGDKQPRARAFNVVVVVIIIMMMAGFSVHFLLVSKILLQFVHDVMVLLYNKYEKNKCTFEIKSFSTKEMLMAFSILSIRLSCSCHSIEQITRHFL